MSDRARALALLAGCAALLVATWVVLLGPRLGDARELGRQARAAEREARELQVRAARLSALADRAPQDRAALRRLSLAVPETPRPAALLQALDAAARGGDVRLLDTAVDAAGAAGAGLPPGVRQTSLGPALPLRLAFSGGYAQLGDLARRLADWVRDEDGRLRARGRLLTLESLELEAAPGRAVDAELTALAFVARPGAAR